MPSALPFQLGEVAVKSVPAFTGLTAAARLTIPGIPMFAERATTYLMRTADARSIRIIDAPVFIYTSDCVPPPPGEGREGVPVTGTDTFLLQIAMPIAPAPGMELEPTSEIQRVHFEAFNCAAAQYTGSMTHIGDAYPLIVEAVQAAGHRIVEQSREVYRHWVAYDSPANIVEIQLGIAEASATPGRG